MAITRTTWTDGSTVINNARLQAIYDAVENTWVPDTYTPAWTSSGTNPAIGNGTIAGKYICIGGKFVDFSVVITMGSSTTYGTGTYFVSLPFEHDGAGFGNIRVLVRDASAGGTPVYAGIAYPSTSTTVVLATSDVAPTAGITATAPITLATSDVIWVAGSYFRS
jgi:hypothetical protein